MSAQARFFLRAIRNLSRLRIDMPWSPAAGLVGAVRCESPAVELMAVQVSTYDEPVNYDGNKATAPATQPFF